MSEGVIVQFIIIFCALLGSRGRMRRFFGWPFLLVYLYSLSALSAPLTLEQAWEQADLANPALRSTQASIEAAQGELSDSHALLWNNPQLASEWRTRTIPQTIAPALINHDWTVGLTQTFEIAGQQGKRRSAAEESLAATQEEIAETRRQLRAEVEQRFVWVLSLQLRIQTEEQTLKLIEEAATAISKRAAAGEDSRLDGNLAKVEAERAQNQVSQLREQLVQARAELATLLQLPADNLPEVDGNLDPSSAALTVEDLLDSAANRPLLRVFEHREKAARSRLDFERASVYPDVTLGLSTAREGQSDTRESVTGLSVSLPLPLFRRNGSGIGRATTELTQVQVQQQAVQRDTRAQVLALWQRWESLQARVKRLNESVLPSLEENQHLSSVSFQVGEIGLLQLLLVNRQVLDGQRDLLDARTELRLTKIALDAAAGL
jgi:cobalt-zinc-cadmium efflux system outer membrane protein